MSELKAYNVVVSNETENYINGETNLAFDAYDADDVDAILAEKDAEIAELKKKLMPCLNGDCILTCDVHSHGSGSANQLPGSFPVSVRVTN